MQIIVNSLATTYQIIGHGVRSILFLHGWGDTFETFKPLLPELTKDYTCILVNLPGFGGSQMPSEAWDIEAYATFIQAFLEKLEIHTLYTVVGHSNGGAIALYGLAHKVFTANKLILIASAGVRATTDQKLHRSAWKAIAKVGKVGTLLLPKRTQQALRSRLYASAGSDLLTVPYMQETFKRVVGQDIREDAALVKQPVLLIYGQKDAATPVEYAKLLAAALPNCELVVVPNAAHFVHQELPVQVTAAMKAFLA